MKRIVNKKVIEMSPTNTDTGEVILYQPNSFMKLEVRLEQETVWLTQMQMAVLFQTTKQNISLHVNNVFKEGELQQEATVKDYLTLQDEGKRQVQRMVSFYNLDVIISVGYRVKSKQGTMFRQWANAVLKDYLLKGYAIHQRVERIEHKMAEHDRKFDFLIQTTLPPKEGVFYDGQIFDAYTFVADLIKSAKKEVVLIDNYVDECTLLLLSKRVEGVVATIYTGRMPASLKLDLQKHNAQYPPINVEKFTRSHDRFLVIDDTVYHIGSSLKDVGKRLFAFSRMDMKRAALLN